MAVPPQFYSVSSTKTIWGGQGRTGSDATARVCPVTYLKIVEMRS